MRIERKKKLYHFQLLYGIDLGELEKKFWIMPGIDRGLAN